MKQARARKRDRAFPSLATALAAALAVVAACGGAAAAEPRLRNLVFQPAKVSLAPGETHALTVVGVYDDQTTRDLTAETKLEAKDAKVVEVLGTTIRAVGGGKTTVKAKHGPTGATSDDPLEVTVEKIRELAIVPPSLQLASGDSAQVRALATTDGGRTGIDVSTLVEWTSSQRDVASVFAGHVRALAPGTAQLEVKDRASGVRSAKNSASVVVTAAPGSGGGSAGGSAGGPKIDALDVEPLTATLLAGESVSLRATARFSDGTTKDVTSECTFRSSRETTATVDATGHAIAVSPGRASIRVVHASGKSATRDPEVWVGAVRELSLSPASPSLAEGDTLALRALAAYDNERSADVTASVAWSTSDARVVAVSDVGGTKGRVTAVGPGSAVVTARDRSSGVESRREAGTVRVGGSPGEEPEAELDPRDVRDLVLEPSVLRLRPGDSRDVRVRAVLRDGSMRDVTSSAVRRSRSTRVARVSEEGSIVAVAGGETEIRAEHPPSRKTSAVPARVHVSKLRALRIDPADVLLAVGDERPLRALGDYDDGTSDVDVTKEVRWTSSRPVVAVVDDEGRRGNVTALANGTAELRVEDPASRIRSDRSTGRVRVGDAAPGDAGEVIALRFEPASLLLSIGEQARFETLAVLADGTTEPLPPEALRYAATSRSAVRVGRSGDVVARRAGTGGVAVEHRATATKGVLPVSVRAVARIEVAPPSIALRPGESADFRALAWFNDGSGPVDVTASSVWSGLDANVVKVSRDVPGRVVAVAPGFARVEARDRTSRERSDPATGAVRVLGDLRRIVVEPSRVVLAPGALQAFRAIAVFADGTTVDLPSDTVLWSTSNNRYGTIDSRGVATIIGPNSFLVRARDLLSGISSRDSSSDGSVVIGGSDILGLQVTDQTTIAEEPRTVRLGAGEVRPLRALASQVGRTEPLDFSSRVDWLSSHPQIASVGKGGLVSCLSQGIAVVSASDPETGLASSPTLGDATVICGGDVLHLRIQPATVNLDYPASRSMKAFRVFRDGHEVDATDKVVWTSSDPAKLAIVESGAQAGRVTAIDDVIATVSAFDPKFGVASSDPGGTSGAVTVRKKRVDLRIFPLDPPASSDGIVRARVGEVIKLRARVEYASGATQGVNVLVQWSSSDPTIVRMGDGTGEMLVNHGEMLRPGRVTITARWPADEFSKELTAKFTVEAVL